MNSLKRNDGKLTERAMSTSFYDIGVKKYTVNGIIALEIKEKDSEDVNVFMLNRNEIRHLAGVLQLFLQNAEGEN